jgi:hypothetical protein
LEIRAKNEAVKFFMAEIDKDQQLEAAVTELLKDVK